MSDRDEIPRYLENWQDEVDSAAEYRAMAAAEADHRLAKVYSHLAAMEESHVGVWVVRVPQPRKGRGRRLGRRLRDSRHRPGRSSGGRLLDGPGRMGVGDERPRAG